MMFLPKRNILFSVAVSLALSILLFIIFPVASRRMLDETAVLFTEKGKEAGLEIYREEQREYARMNGKIWIDFLENLSDNTLFSALSEEERQEYFLRTAMKGEAPFVIIDGEGRLWTDRNLPEVPVLPSQVKAGETLITDWNGGEFCFRYFEPWNWILALPVDFSRTEIITGKISSLGEGYGDIVRTYQERKAGAFFFAIFGILLLFSLSVSYFISKEKGSSHEMNHYYRALNDSLCLMVTDRDGIITKVNENYEKISGYTEEELIGKNHFYIHHPDSLQKQREEMRKSLYSTHRWRGQIKAITPQGEAYWLQAFISELWDEKNEINGYLAVAQDVSELHTHKKRLEKAVHTDPLTGFGNRLQLLEDLEKFPRSYIACFNIDGFSNINKLFGFTSGDNLLLEVGKNLNELLLPLRESLYRLNGDTFVIRGFNDEEEEFVNRNIGRQERLNPLSFDKGASPYTVSLRMGISTCPQNTLLLADSAMKGAKSDTRGYMVIRAGDDEKEATGLKQIEQLNMVKSALENNRLSLVFQPIANTRTGEVVKYECLLRILDEQGMSINPSELIEVAKKGRLYKQITRFVIDEMMEASGRCGLDFSINFTLEDFLDSDTVSYLVEEASRRGVSERIILEIVETEELADYENLEIIFRKLKEKGFRIAIDDFGSGFSNFNYLLRLNVDYIKIDGSLIRNILTDEKSQSLVVSIILFAVESGFQTIAEYIETSDIMERIRSLGIDFAQGYFVGKPGAIPG